MQAKPEYETLWEAPFNEEVAREYGLKSEYNFRGGKEDPFYPKKIGYIIPRGSLHKVNNSLPDMVCSFDSYGNMLELVKIGDEDDE